MRRKRMKSNFVSSGTSRRCGITPRTTSAHTTAMTARRTATSRYSTAPLAESDRHVPRPPQPHPPGHDQPRQGEGGENGRDDADAERNCEAAYRTGADEEQH